MYKHWQLLLFSCFVLFFSCKSQQKNANKPIAKIENHTKGNLEIKVAPFGLDNNKITVGQILTDGSILLKWPALDSISSDDKAFYMSSLKRVAGMSFCNEKQIEESSKTAKAVEVQLELYSKGKPVGFLYPATQKDMRHNASLNRHTSLVLGSYLTWVYSDSDGNFKASCKVNMESEGVYNFEEVTKYDLKLKQGWNIINHTLVEKEDWESESKKGSFPKTVTITSVTNIPNTINWYINYFGQ